LILAFDTSVARTGYVLGKPGGPVRVGSFGVREGARERMGSLQHEWLQTALPLIKQADRVYFEAPINPQHMNFETQRKIWAVVSILEYGLHRLNVPGYAIANGSHKKLIYDHGGPKPENTVEYAQAWGLNATNNDQADACGIFLYALSRDYADAFRGWLSIRRKAPLVVRIAKPKKPGKGKAGHKVQPRRTLAAPTLFQE